MSSVRVVARVRPLLKSELAKDNIITTSSSDSEGLNKANIVRIPNPKNAGEDFSFQFNSVYDQEATQQDIFDNEVSPTIKHLFAGFDVTLFAYGVTGTGKTHTMRGGKTIAERGVIPRLLSGIYRRSRKIEKDSQGHTEVDVSMSYYEIYNDRVFDLFEAPEKRTLTGLQLRDNGGKTVVVGLTERPCESLKEFEKLYDQANVNRSTSATKLNAHSSRSHAVLCVKLTTTTGDETRVSTAWAIDLAGSEDNRRTDNGKERLVESASINKSLFVLAQCVEAISKKQARIPYRESKMTRILSLGQNNGLTVMILNLAPVRSYHLDTLSSLNFANRTKKIETREVENEPIIKGCSRAVPTFTGSTIQRQPLRPLTSTAHNATIHSVNTGTKPGDKPSKAFFVYSDTSKPRLSNPAQVRPTEAPKRSPPFKRPSDSFGPTVTRPLKYARTSPECLRKPEPTISKAAIEDIIEKKVTEILAARALDQPSMASVPEISEEVQRRLEMLEKKIDGKDDGRAEGLTFLLMAKQHHVRGEDSSALKMYELAKEHFPANPKLDGKIAKLRERLRRKGNETDQRAQAHTPPPSSEPPAAPPSIRRSTPTPAPHPNPPRPLRRQLPLHVQPRQAPRRRQCNSRRLPRSASPRRPASHAPH
ncbi:MAG: Kinesin family [Lasallia pustulata]|uniref:Kinesin family n=1 Tax=Lasallia pustulata TaxID=136370 RepID=A0A5M8PPE9_9LECA|nr:MAG: Kinesin family [Lasallia pustulata]